VPAEGKQREQQCAGGNRDQQEAPRHVVGDNNARIDSGRRMKRVGQVHGDHGKPDRKRRDPRGRPSQLDHQQSDERRNKMATDQRARLRGSGLRGAQHQHEGGRERNGHQRKRGAGGERLHDADSDSSAGPAGEDRE
jgi:hypothetical protein